MKSVLQLLVEAPVGEVTRMQLVYKAIVVGDWAEAWFHLSNISADDSDSLEAALWKKDAYALCDLCLQVRKVVKGQFNKGETK